MQVLPPRRGVAALALAGMVLGAGGAPGLAQERPPEVGLGFGVPQVTSPLGRAIPVSPVLTVDSDRVYGESAWGRRVLAETRARLRDLEAENQRISADLAAEERSLTERRAEMAPEEFRAAADAFDARVVGIRRAQEAKSRDIARQAEAERAAFIEAALPAVGEVLARRGAVVILDRKQVFVATDAVDVTDELISALNDRLGDGAASPRGAVPAEAPAPELAPAAPADPAADPAPGAAIPAPGGPLDLPTGAGATGQPDALSDGPDGG
ncbi:OmpH family outer membrane protein [Phaeovulum vinaykumarii]|uniref:OmpH family outer membrane protein n=1 Tax=Phaeovulum vinaykumarii TaxID=407234 RepID=UPI000970F391|nr:OmpH family outer membrane protein [Phaeovulum vinaykumarii]